MLNSGRRKGHLVVTASVTSKKKKASVTSWMLGPSASASKTEPRKLTHQKHQHEINIETELAASNNSPLSSKILWESTTTNTCYGPQAVPDFD